MESTKRTLIASGISLICCIMLLVGATFAWFTSSVTVSGNKIKAGTVAVSLLKYDGIGYKDIGNDTLFDDTLYEPGKTLVAGIAVRNDGTLPLKY